MSECVLTGAKNLENWEQWKHGKHPTISCFSPSVTTSLPPVFSLYASSLPSLPVCESFGGFSALPGWIPTYLNHRRVPIQNPELGSVTSTSSQTRLSPLLILVCLSLKVISYGLFSALLWWRPLWFYTLWIQPMIKHLVDKKRHANREPVSFGDIKD